MRKLSDDLILKIFKYLNICGYNNVSKYYLISKYYYNFFKKKYGLCEYKKFIGLKFCFTHYNHLFKNYKIKF